MIYTKSGEYKGFLIGNELYTSNEITKLVKNTGIDLLKFMNNFIPIELPKNRIYWFFGARFEKSKK